jgi:hypothetical protein
METRFLAFEASARKVHCSAIVGALFLGLSGTMTLGASIGGGGPDGLPSPSLAGRY